MHDDPVVTPVMTLQGLRERVGTVAEALGTHPQEALLLMQPQGSCRLWQRPSTDASNEDCHRPRDADHGEPGEGWRRLGRPSSSPHM